MLESQSVIWIKAIVYIDTLFGRHGECLLFIIIYACNRPHVKMKLFFFFKLLHHKQAR